MQAGLRVCEPYKHNFISTKSTQEVCEKCNAVRKPSANRKNFINRKLEEVKKQKTRKPKEMDYV